MNLYDFETEKMDKSFVDVLLNGIPVSTFWGLYVASIFGAFVWLMIRTNIAISKDPNTPYVFKWKYFWKGLFKLFLSIIVLPWAVLYFPSYGPVIMSELFKFPQVEGGKQLIVEMNAGAAAIIGFFIDIAVRKLTDKTINNYISKNGVY